MAASAAVIDMKDEELILKEGDRVNFAIKGLDESLIGKVRQTCGSWVKLSDTKDDGYNTAEPGWYNWSRILWFNVIEESK